jgi:hypothetical protein
MLAAVCAVRAMFKVTQLVGFGAGDSGGCVGQTEITYSTAIGDYTSNGGLAAAFDGTTDQTAAASAATSGANQDGYIGDDAGAGNSHKINGVKIWGSNNAGYTSGTTNFDVELYGSNSAPSSSTDGTLIVTLESNHTGGNVTDPLDYTSSPTWTPVAYRYNWVRINRVSGADINYMAELELYECA